MPIKLLIADGDNTSWDTELIRDCPSDLTRLRAFPDTVRTFSAISDVLRIPVALVTMGNRLVQQQKVKILGLEGLFSECVYCERGHEKGLAFNDLIRRHTCSPGEVIVVGDRVDNEIFYGNELGCITVRMIHGKYAVQKPADLSQVPRFEITELADLIRIVRL